jgi:hypothetical protein
MRRMGARTVAVGIAALASIAAPASSGLAAAALPPPSFGRTLDIGLVSGTVVVTPPSGPSFTLGPKDRNIPIGSLIDTTRGRVDLRAAPAPAHAAAAARVEDGQFSGGAFHVRQTSSMPFTQIRLAGARGAPCPAPARARIAARPHRILRLLHATAHGRFQTDGRYAAATVRGTVWLTEDFCDGTLVRVTRGVVSVEDLVTHRTIAVSAPHSYFARAPGA